MEKRKELPEAARALNVTAIRVFAALFTACAALFCCDMDAVNRYEGGEGPSGGGTDTGGGGDEEPSSPEDAEKIGHYLIVRGLPYNTLSENITAPVVASSTAGAVAKGKESGVLIKDGIGYIPLYKVRGGDYFYGSGWFWTGISVNVDAVTRMILKVSDGILIEFRNGTGTLDLSKLAFRDDGTIDPDNPFINPGDPDNPGTDPDPPEGHYPTVRHLPRNTFPENIGDVTVFNAAGERAVAAPADVIIINKTTAYIPLVSPEGPAFTENWNFWVTISVGTPSSPAVSIIRESGIMIPFYDGCGVLDLDSLPEPVPPPPPGHYLTVINLYETVTAEKVTDVFVGADGILARGTGDVLILGQTIYVPLKNPDGTDFMSSGDYYTAVTITVDTTKKIAIRLAERVTVPYTTAAEHSTLTASPKK